MSVPEPSIADVLAAIAAPDTKLTQLRVDLMARIVRLDAAVAQRGRDVTSLLEQNTPGRGEGA